MIELKRYFQKAHFLDPRREYKPTEQIIEYRKDPLIDSRWCRINQDRARRSEQLHTISDNDEINQLLDRSKHECSFERDRIETQTPSFSKNLVSEGRIRQAQSTLFPNLYPFNKYHAICVISNKHYLELPDITPGQWRNAFEVCLRYQMRVFDAEVDARFPMINMNFNPPAGASIIHPHLQVLIGLNPTNLLRNGINASKQYYERYARCFWEDLIDKERELNERYIGEGRFFSWIANWAPLCDNEVMGIINKPIANLLAIDDQVLDSFCDDLSAVLKGLWEQRNVRSMNFAIYSGPVGEDMNDYFRIHIRIVSRPQMNPYYTSDQGFMELLHQEPIIKVSPENLAKTLRNYL